MAHTNREEALRRVKAHIRHCVREAGPEGLTQREIAVKLGMDPRGVDDVDRIVVKASRIN